MYSSVSSSGSMIPVVPPASTAMLVNVARSSIGQFFKILAGKLEHLADAFARLHVLAGKDDEHHVLRRHVVALLTLQNVTHSFRNANANVFRVPGVRHVSRANAERETAEHAGHARVRVGADNDLSGQREIFDDGVMTNRFRTALRISP